MPSLRLLIDLNRDRIGNLRAVLTSRLLVPQVERRTEVGDQLLRPQAGCVLPAGGEHRLRFGGNWAFRFHAHLIPPTPDSIPPHHASQSPPAAGLSPRTGLVNVPREPLEWGTR